MELIKVDVSDFNTIFQIMDKAFPNSEMRTYDGQRKVFEKPEYNVLMNEEKTAFIAFWHFEDAIYIEHFAVGDGLRGNGIGADMLRKFLQMVKVKIFLEAEPPVDKTAKRRIGFYERMGFVLNPCYYLQPPYRQDEEPIQLKIMTYGEEIDRKQFDEYKKMLYSRVYNYKESGI